MFHKKLLPDHLLCFFSENPIEFCPKNLAGTSPGISLEMPSGIILTKNQPELHPELERRASQGLIVSIIQTNQSKSSRVSGAIFHVFLQRFL